MRDLDVRELPGIMKRQVFSVFIAACLAVTLLPGVCGAQDMPLKRQVKTPEQQLRFAEGLLSRNFHDMAERELRLFLDKHPDHELAPSGMFLLIECLRAQDKVAETMSVINRFRKKWPRHDSSDKLLLWKGELLLRMEKFAQAEDSFRRLTINPDSVTREAAIYFLGQSYARQGKTEQAIDTYQKIADKPFDDEHLYRPYALFSVATAARLEGDFETAHEGFSRLKDGENVPDELRAEAIYRLAEEHFLKDEYQQAIELYELLLVDHPDSFFASEARKRRAWAYFSMGEYERSIELGREWQERNEETFDYEIEYIIGASLANAGFYREALPHFMQLAASAKVPEEYRRLARYHEVFARLHLEQYREAVAKARAFFDDFPKAPEKPDIHYFTGEAFYQLEEYQPAAGHLNKALEVRTPDWDYFVLAGVRLTDCLEKLGRYKDAAAVYRKLSRARGLEDRASMLMRAGDAERQAGDLEGAVQSYEQLMERFPKKSEATRKAAMRLGELYAQLENWGKAEAHVKKLLDDREKGQGRGRLLFFLGYLYYQQDKFQQAVDLLREAIETRESENVINDSRYFLTGALLELDRRREAMEVFAELLVLPMEKRPVFSDDLLFRLEELYYSRNRYDVSEQICRWLLQREDPGVKYRARIRLSRILTVQNKLEEAEKLLSKMLAAQEKLPRQRRRDEAAVETVASMLGEVFLKQGKTDRAVHAFERVRAASDVPMAVQARANWGLAKILAEEERPRQALQYAVNAFVLGNDPTYTPRAMLIAVGLLDKLGRAEEAWTTWKELQQRYPSFAEQHADDDIVAQVKNKQGAADAD